MAKIKFTFEDKNIPDKIVDNAEKGYSILEITEDHDIHLNHNCGGVCACSTCHIYVQKGEDDVEAPDDVAAPDVAAPEAPESPPSPMAKEPEVAAPSPAGEGPADKPQPEQPGRKKRRQGGQRGRRGDWERPRSSRLPDIARADARKKK